MKVGTAWQAKIIPGPRWDAAGLPEPHKRRRSYGFVAGLACGAPECGARVAEIRSVPVASWHRAYRVVERHWANRIELAGGFVRDASGDFALSARAERQWRHAKRGRVNWHHFRAKARAPIGDGGYPDLPPVKLPAGRFRFVCPVCRRLNVADVPAESDVAVTRCKAPKCPGCLTMFRWEAERAEAEREERAWAEGFVQLGGETIGGETVGDGGHSSRGEE